MILQALDREDSEDLESFSRRVAGGGDRVRKVVRRLFEEGYIEQVE